MTTFIITGMGSGICQVLAEDLAKDRRNEIFGFSNIPIPAGRFSKYPNIFYRQGEVWNLEFWRCFVKDILDSPGDHVDVLVNGAAMYSSSIPGKPDTIASSKYIIDTNVLGLVMGVDQVVASWLREDLTDGRCRRIINISSGSATRVMESSSMYCASKAAVSMLTRCWAAELAEHNIFVGEVCPDTLTRKMADEDIDPDEIKLTDKVPLGRTGSINDVVDVILYLIEDAPMFATGCSISVSGARF